MFFQVIMINNRHINVTSMPLCLFCIALQKQHGVSQYMFNVIVSCYSIPLYEIKMKHIFLVPENRSDCFHIQILFTFFELARVAGVHCASIALTVL